MQKPWQSRRPHHTCPFQVDNDWEQFVSYSEDTEDQEITTLTETQDPEIVPLTPIDSAIFETYKPLTVGQIEVEAYKEDMARMYEHYKQHKRDH